MPRTTIPSVCRAALGLVLLCAAPAVCRPDALDGLPAATGDRLVNVDTLAAIERSAVSARADVRVFGAEEDLTYVGLQLGYGATETLELVLRAVLAGRKTYDFGEGAIRHGGSDIELLARCHPASTPDIGYALGIAFPNTPAQDEPVITAQVLWQRVLSDAVTLHVTPRAALVRDNPLIGIGAGLACRLSEAVAVVGDLTCLVSGDNTRSIFNGEKKRGSVWGLGVRFGKADDPRGPRIDVGVTNGIGTTTGFSLTPGLSGSTALYAAASWRW